MTDKGFLHCFDSCKVETEPDLSICLKGCSVKAFNENPQGMPNFDMEENPSLVFEILSPQKNVILTAKVSQPSKNKIICQ